MSIVAIEAALEERLLTLPNPPPIAWEDVAFEPATGQGYLRVHHLHNHPRDLFLEGGPAELPGIFQVRTVPDVRTIRACLTDLEDAGLVIQQPAGMFRRRPVSVDKEKATAQQTHTIEQKEAEPMNAATQVNALDKLAELSGELAEIAGQLQLRLVRVTKIARELEDVALAVEQERENGAKKSEKLNQLQKLLADLAKG